MKLLASGIDTVECAYYVRPGPDCKLDFEALRQQRETIRQSRDPETGVLSLGGIDYLLSPNGTRSDYPFLISNQLSAIQFGEFNDPGFFVTYQSFALWMRGSKQVHQEFLDWAASLGLVAARPEGLSRVDFAFDFSLPEIDFNEDSFVSMADKDTLARTTRCACRKRSCPSWSWPPTGFMRPWRRTFCRWTTCCAIGRKRSRRGGKRCWWRWLGRGGTRRCLRPCCRRNRSKRLVLSCGRA